MVPAVFRHHRNRHCAVQRRLTMALSSRSFVVVLLLLSLTTRSTVNSTGIANPLTVSSASSDIYLGFAGGTLTSSDGKTSCDKISPYACSSMLQTMKFALDELNADVRILPNISVGYVAKDACATPTGGILAAYDIVNNQVAAAGGNRTEHLNVVGVIGPLGSTSVFFATALMGMYYMHMEKTCLLGFLQMVHQQFIFVKMKSYNREHRFFNQRLETQN